MERFPARLGTLRRSQGFPVGTLGTLRRSEGFPVGTLRILRRSEGFPVGTLGTIVAAGVALRALYLFTVARHVSGVGDWWFYHWQANDLASGHFFVEPFRLRFNHQEFPSAGHPPLYPALLSVVSWLGGTSVMWHRAFGLVCGAASIALMGVLGRRVGGDRLGLAAAGVCAAYPLMVVVDGALMSETAYTPLVILVLLAALARRTFWLGAAIGLAALCRSEALLLLPVLAWPVLWRQGIAKPALATLGCVVVIAPWTIRNAVALGHVVPISTNDSTVLTGANCPKTYSGPDIGFWRFDCLAPRKADNEAEQSDIWRADGLRYAREHASRLLVVIPVRILRTVSLYQPRRQVLFAEGRWIHGEQMAVAAFYLLALLSFAGAVMLRRGGTPLWVLLAPAVVVLITVVIGYGHPRLRHVFEPSLMLMGASGGLWAWDQLRARTGGASARARERARVASASS
ncbi:ArnT family glycosyltransferase [Candidatus Solirubrobacter pratensis]|uniref:ArnT family glycosyltransferase n=1 Tax=Candidatus Solirubrobacter pratensis TaxID=1298857 RepID=UPI000488C9BA|nr:glycosyltransferase family 39 protein [Candidatus Solirubrobacter pratensis]